MADVGKHSSVQNTPNLLAGFYIPFDEFNTLIYSNMIAKKLKEVNPATKLITCAFPNFLPLYNFFDEILILKWQHNISPIDLSANNRDVRKSLNKAASELLRRRHIQVPREMKDIQEQVTAKFGNTIHKQTLGLSIEHMLEGSKLLVASASDRHKALQFLKKNRVSSNYVVIIGRNRQIHNHHNNLLERQIHESLDKGSFVVNLTFPSPGLSSSFCNKYIEIPDEENSYGVSLAIMEGALMNFVWGNAGGVSIHLLTDFPITVVGPMNWINSPKYSYKGKTLFQARRSRGIETLHTWGGIKITLRIKSNLRYILDLLSHILI